MKKMNEMVSKKNDRIERFRYELYRLEDKYHYIVFFGQIVGGKTYLIRIFDKDLTELASRYVAKRDISNHDFPEELAFSIFYNMLVSTGINFLMKRSN